MTIASFNNYGALAAIRCSDHKVIGMVDVLHGFELFAKSKGARNVPASTCLVISQLFVAVTTRYQAWWWSDDRNCCIVY